MRVGGRSLPDVIGEIGLASRHGRGRGDNDWLSAVARIEANPYKVAYLHRDDDAVSRPGAKGKLVSSPRQIFIGDSREYLGYPHLNAHPLLRVLLIDHRPPVRAFVLFRLRQDRSPPSPCIEIFGCSMNGRRRSRRFFRAAFHQAGVLDSPYARGI